MTWVKAPDRGRVFPVGIEMVTGEIDMNDTFAAWHGEHIYYGHLLDVLEDEVTAFHHGQVPDYTLMRDIVSYLRDGPDRHHHPREDAAFERLLVREPTLRLPINRLLQEHRVIAVTGEELLNRLDEVAADAVVERKGLEAAAAVFLVYYRHHIAAEETDIMPRLLTLLTDDDWREVARAVPPPADPLFEDAFAERYRALTRRATQKARRGPQATKGHAVPAASTSARTPRD